MKRLGYGLALVVFIIDQLVKYWILEIVRLPEQGSIQLAPFFSLTFVGNVGVSMGMFQASSDMQRWGLVAVTAGIAAVVAFWIAREQQRTEVMALRPRARRRARQYRRSHPLRLCRRLPALLLGGASFWVFNVADAAITLGVLVLLWRALTAPKGSV